MANIQIIQPTAIQSAQLRVAAYCRVSSDSADQLNSYNVQVAHYQQFISSQPNWALVEIYADEGITGTRTDKRFEFQRLMKDCRKGRIDKIIVKSISRFARNFRDCLSSIRELKSLGVEVFFEKEQINTSAMGGEMMLSIYSMLAQEESISISNNMRWSLQRRMQAGEFITCTPAYGYALTNGTLAIKEHEAEIVRWIYNRYLAGESIVEISSQLNAQRIAPCKGAKRWWGSAVQYILSNEKYIGDSVVQKSYTTNTLPFMRKRNHGEVSSYYIEHTHPPIVSKMEFQCAAELGLQRKNTGTKKHWHPFRRRLICGECGHHFIRRFENSKYYWACDHHWRSKANCSMCRLKEPILEGAALRLWQKLHTNRNDILLPMITQLEDYQSQSALQNASVVAIDTQIAEHHAHNQALAQLRAKGYMDVAMYTAQTNHNNSAIHTLHQQRRQLLEHDEDETMEQSRKLLQLLGDEISKFDATLFLESVVQIKVISPTLLQFTLCNGLLLNEKIPYLRRYSV